MKAKLTLTIPAWLDKICVWPLLLYRKYKFGFPFRKIDLGAGKFTIVDPPDYYLLQGYIWWAHANGSNLYAARTEITDDLKTRIVYLHRQLMQPADGFVVDHKNCKPLDNRRANMRNVTPAQNMRNRRKRKNTSSQFIGVSLRKSRNRFDVNIRHNGKKIYLGSYDNEIDAARAYDRAALEYYGEFARLNFPREDYINEISSS